MAGSKFKFNMEYPRVLRSINIVDVKITEFVSTKKYITIFIRMPTSLASLKV